MTSFFLRLYAFFVQKPLLLLVLCLTIFGIGLYDLLHLNLEENIANVLPQDSKLAEYEELLENSSNGNNIIFILKNDQKDINALCQTGQQLQEDLSKNLSDSIVKIITISINENSFLDILNNIYSNLPQYVSSNHLNELSLDEDVLSKKINKKLKVLFTPAGSIMQQNILNDPFDLSIPALKNLQSLQFDNNFTIKNSFLISNDSLYLLGFLKLNETINNSGQKTELLKIINTTIQNINKTQNTHAYAFGAPLISEENALRIKKDIMLTVNIALGILLLALSLYFKNFKAIMAFIIPVLMGAFSAIIFIFLKQDYVSAISLGMGSVLLGTIIDYAIHILTHLKSDANPELSIKHTAKSIMAGSVTTAVSFLSLLLIQSKALNDLALFAALSMLFGAFFSVLLLPIIFKNTFKNTQKKKNIIDQLAATPFHNNIYLVIACFIVVVVSIFFIPKIRFSKDLNELNYMPSYIQQAENELNKASNTLKSSLFVIVEGNTLNDALLKTEKLEAFLENDKSKGKINEIKSISSLLASKEKQENSITEWKQFWTNDKIQIVEKTLLNESKTLGFNDEAFTPFLQQLKNPTPKENTLNTITENYITISNNKYISSVILKVNKENKNDVINKIEAFDKSVHVIDKSNLIQGLISEVKDSLQKISWILLFIILLILTIYFKKPETVLLAFTPVFLSWITTLGLMGLLHISFNMLNIIVVIFIFGLGIDYSIFILSALINDYEKGENQFNTVKSAVFLSAATTFIGIGVLIFAKHPALYSIAKAGMIAVLSVFTFAIVLLPFLFNKLVVNRANKGFEPITFKSTYDTFLSYFSLVVGVLVITLLGIILRILFFIPIKKRKLFFHKAFNFWAKLYIKILFPGKHFAIENESNEDFSTPCIIIANHQSLIDTPLMVSLTPKLILLTKKWVRNNPLFGIGSRLADFYSVDDDMNENIENLKEKVNDGFSVALFPEGTRSIDKNLLRFYRGAFTLAEELDLDIVPIIINGTIDTLHKNQFFGQRRNLTVKVLPRISKNNLDFGNDKIERYKKIRDFFKSNYYKNRGLTDNGTNLKMQVLSNYLYKSPILYKQAKSYFSKYHNFTDLQDVFLNDDATLIIDNFNGVICILQNMINPNKSIDVLSTKANIIKHCYNAAKSNLYYQSIEQINKKYETIIIADDTFNLDLLTTITISNSKIIQLDCATNNIKNF